MANSLPLALRVYRKLSAAMVPLAPALIKRRLKQGKEDPARIGERRGVSQEVRPHGPLIWIHGASVGEVLAAAALIEKLRALNIRILLTSGTVTSAAIVARRFPADIIHQYVPYDSPRYVARFLDHWQPSLALFADEVGEFFGAKVEKLLPQARWGGGEEIVGGDDWIGELAFGVELAERSIPRQYGLTEALEDVVHAGRQ